MGRVAISLLALAHLTLTWADDPMSVGQFSHAAMDPLAVLAKVFYTIFFVTGGSLLIGSLVKLKEHRYHPSRATRVQIVSWFIFGLLFIVTPFIVQLSRGASLLS